jgi:hypothetical protein
MRIILLFIMSDGEYTWLFIDEMVVSVILEFLLI